MKAQADKSRDGFNVSGGSLGTFKATTLSPNF